MNRKPCVAPPALFIFAPISSQGSRPGLTSRRASGAGLLHPLAQQYHYGITPERVKEIMMTCLQENE